MKSYLALLSLVITTPLLAAPCNTDTPIATFCEIDFNQLHPTQPAIGLMQVEDEMKSYADKHGQDLIKLMRKKEIPVVIGPDGRFYLTDRHHLSSALWRLNVPTATVKIIGKLDNAQTFWAEMQAHHWAWLYDQRGAALPPAQLPKSLAELKDDPYRSLAGYAEHADDFHNADQTYFLEFYWARYFGEHMQWQVITREQLPQALQKAKVLACQPAAQALPGYRSDCKTN